MQEREIEIERVGTFFYSLAMLATTCIDFYQYFFTIDASTNESLFLQVTSNTCNTQMQNTSFKVQKNNNICNVF